MLNEMSNMTTLHNYSQNIQHDSKTIILTEITIKQNQRLKLDTRPKVIKEVHDIILL